MGVLDSWDAPDEYQIKRYIQKLDQVATSMEAKWGIGTLERIVPDGLREKWERQRDKLNDAIERKSVVDVGRHVEATIKGWAALEAEAIKARASRPDAEYWEIKSDKGNLYRIVKNRADVAAVAAMDGGDSVRVWSLEEVARVLDCNDLVTVQEIKRHFPDCDLRRIGKSFDFDKGDDIPF